MNAARALGGARADEPSTDDIIELLSGIDAVAWSADPSTLRVVAVTGSMKSLGHSVEAIRADGFWDEVIHPEDRAATTALWRATAADARSRSSVHRVRTREGAQRWVDTRVRASRGPDGRVRHLVGLTVDITNLRQANELIARERAAELVLEQLPAIVYALDRDLNFVWGGGAGLARLGIGPGQLGGVNIAKYLQTDDPRHPTLENHRRAVAGENLSYDAAFGDRKFAVRLRPFRDGADAIIGVLGVAIDVTDLRQVELARAESEDRFRSLADASFEGIAIHENGRVLLANRAFASILGYSSPEEVVGLGVLDFAHPSTRPRVTQHFLSRSEAPIRGEAIRKDGSVFIAEVRSRNARFRDAAVRVSAVRDVTEQVRAEDERERLLAQQRELTRTLQQRVAEWESVLASVADAVVVFDTNSVVTFVNEAASRMFGVESAELRRPLHDLADRFGLRPAHEQLDPSDAPSERALRGERLEAADVSYVPDHGEPRLARVSAAPIRIEGHVVGGVMVSRDVTAERKAATERERLLEEVTARRHLVEAIVATAPIGIMVHRGHDMVCELVNPAFADVFPERNPVGRPFVEVWPELGPDGPRYLRTALETGQPQSWSDLLFPLRRPSDGLLEDRYFTMSVAPVPEPDGRVERVLLCFLETTHEVRNRTEMQQLAEAATQRANELAEFERLKDQFIRVAAHELKTPVAVMKGYAQLLLRGDATEVRKGPLDAIVRGSNRIDRVVQELVDVSQLALGTMALATERVDLSDLVREVVEHGRDSSRHHLRVETEPDACVRGDAYRLRYVVSNMLDNAFRYSPHGGDIDVSVRVEGDTVLVSLEDHGVGIPATRQARIFERFYRAHTDTPYDYGGIGVGLSISREIVRRQGGEMGFRSTEGSGSTFWFRLPREASDVR